jgi:hypothetical protein
MATLRDAPWSAAWTSEQSFSLSPSTDFPGLLQLDQAQSRGVGEPIFGAMNATRLRRAMVDLLCHVCGKRTEWRDRYIFPVASGGLVALQDGSEQYRCTGPARCAPIMPALTWGRCARRRSVARATRAG